jgi:hypothetical protein
MIRKIRFSIRHAMFVILILAVVFAIVERNLRMIRLRNALIQYDTAKDRVKWSRAMQTKGYVSKSAVETEEKALEEARKALAEAY